MNVMIKNMSCKIRKLSELATVLNGATPDTNTPEYWNGNILWLTPKDIGRLSSKFISDSERKITELGLQSCSSTIIPEYSVLLTSRAPVGNIAVNTVPVCTNQGFKSIIPKEGIYWDYLYHYLCFLRPTLDSLSHGNTFMEIMKEKVDSLDILIPDKYEDQVAIANQLDDKLQKVEKLHKAILMQEEAFQNLYSAYFRDVWPWNPLDPQPDGLKWKKSSLKKLCIDIKGGGTPDRSNPDYWNGDIPWISSADIINLYTVQPRRYITQKAIKESATNIVPKGSIIIVTRVGVGKLCVAPFDLCFSQDSHGLILDTNQINPNYLLLYLLSIMKSVIFSSQGSTVKGITRDVLETIPIIIPIDHIEQITIAEKLYSIFGHLDQINQDLGKQKNAIFSLNTTILNETFSKVKESL